MVFLKGFFMDCIFCKITAGDLPCYKIYENEYVLAFLDIANDFEGHTLVIPKKHCKNILDCDEFYLNEIIKAVKLISNKYIKKGYDGVDVINANEEAAQQSVFHLHFHIIPRKINDGINVFPNRKDLKLDLQNIADKLKIN